MQRRYPEMKPTNEEEEMGNSFRINSPEYHLAPPPAPPKKGLGTIGKLALGAGLLATGAGIGFGIPLLIDALSTETITETTTETETTIEHPGSDADWRLGTPRVE